jgi:hypothetical protein
MNCREREIREEEMREEKRRGRTKTWANTWQPLMDACIH